MKLARVDYKGKLVEFFDIENPVHISERFHPDLVVQLIEVPGDTQLYVTSYINGELVNTPEEE